jgi:hypothetical protein
MKGTIVHEIAVVMGGPGSESKGIRDLCEAHYEGTVKIEIYNKTKNKT